MNTTNLNEFLYVEPDTYKMTTSSIARNLPVFEQIIGADIPITIELGYRDMKIKFNPDLETHLQIDFIQIVKVHEGSEAHDHPVFWDEIPT